MNIDINNTAKGYFGKNVEDLTREELIFLVNYFSGQTEAIMNAHVDLEKKYFDAISRIPYSQTLTKP